MSRNGPKGKDEDGNVVHYGLCPPEVRDMLSTFVCASRSGNLGSLQPLDVIHEEGQRDLHKSSSCC